MRAHFSSNSLAFCLASAFASAAFSAILYFSSISDAFASAAAFASLTNAGALRTQTEDG